MLETKLKTKYIMQTVYKLKFDCGRMGQLGGLFVADSDVVNWLIKSELEVYFGEVLGKHSEVYGPLSNDDIEVVSTEKSVVDIITNYNLSNGYNPLQYTLLGTEDLLGDKYEDDLTAIEVYSKLHS